MSAESFVGSMIVDFKLTEADTRAGDRQIDGDTDAPTYCFEGEGLRCLVESFFSLDEVARYSATSHKK